MNIFDNIKTGILHEWATRETLYSTVELSDGTWTTLEAMFAVGWHPTFAPLGPGESGACRVVFTRELRNEG